MKTKIILRSLAALPLVMVLCLAGCRSEEHRTAAAPPLEQKAPAVAPVVPDGMVRSSFNYPSNNPGDAVVMLQRVAPAETAVGQPFAYTMYVTNLTDMKLSNVVATEQLAPEFEVLSADPKPESSTVGEVRWNLGDLSAKQSKTIKVTGKAKKVGTLVDCAFVTYLPAPCLATNVIQPALTLTKTMPESAILCDVLPTKYVVTNTGTGLARHVVLTDALPQGMMTEDKKNRVEVAIGDLPAGEARAVSVNLKANQKGKFTNRAVATGDGGLSADATAAVTITQPVLKITKTGPAKQYIGRDFTYELTVTNTGDAPAKDLILEDPIPQGTQLVSATDRATTDKVRVMWNLGTLAPNEAKKVNVTLNSAVAGAIHNTASAKAYCAETVTAAADTVIRGIPAILLEMVDDPDPIELGKTTTYTITVTNQGTAIDSNIKVVCTMEDTMGYESNSGATKGSVDGMTVTFEPLVSLAPKEKAQWKVVVKALKEGDVRFKVAINSDATTRPVEKSESTHFYK